MAGPAKKMPAPAPPKARDIPAVSGSGEAIFVPETEMDSLDASGGREMGAPEAAYVQHQIQVENEPFDPVDYVAAGAHARVRGQTEAFGLSIDEKIADLASLYGGPEGRKKAIDYIKKLEEVYPTTHAINRTLGLVGGAIAGAEVTGGGFSAGMPRTVGGVASRMARGGIENTAQNVASDFNEVALGRADLNSEKIYAAMPKHFAIGATLVGGLEAGFYGIEKGIGALAKSGVPALERGASGAIGREVGAEGAEAVSVGERVRGLNRGEIPGNPSELADLLGAEQTAQRGAARTKHASIVDALETSQTREAGALTLRQEAARKVGLRRGAQGIQAAEEARGSSILDAMAEGGAGVESAELAAMRARQQVEREIREIDSARSTIKAERETANDLAERIGKERAEHAAELEKASRHANEISVAENMEMDPAYIRSIVGEDAPSALDYFNPMDGRKLAKSLAAMGSAETEAARLEIQRLTQVGEQIDVAHRQAIGHVTQLDSVLRTLDFQYGIRLEQIAGARVNPEIEAATAAAGQARKEGLKNVARVEKEADAGVRSAEKQAEAERRGFEKGSEKERKALDAKQKEEARKIPKLNERTDVDPPVEKARSRASAPRSSLPGNAALGAVISLSHGNVAGAALSALTGLAGSAAKMHGNFIAARIMRGLSKEITSMDSAIRRGAMDMLRGTASKAANVVDDDRKKKPSFEEVSKRVIEARGNPMVLQNRVNMAVGKWAVTAPMLYASVLTASERAQAFLESVLPQPQKDPYSLTPHLEPSDISEGDKYDFMQYVAAIDDPIAVFRDVKAGTVTDQQIEAVRAVYPNLYLQMQAETDRQIRMLTKPLPYELEINVGRLMEVQTNQVLEPMFQNQLRISYESKEEAGAPAKGSRQSSGDSKVGKAYMSESQRVERGE